MSWTITETNQRDEQATDRLGNKFLLGNGYVGYRGTLEEYTKEQKTATIVSGLYDKVGSLWREPINLPNGGYVQAFYKGVPLHAQTSSVVKHSQTLDIRRAVHERSTTFQTEDGIIITIHSKRFVSAAQHHLFCLQYSIEASQDCELDIRTGIDGDVWDLNGPHLCDFKSAVQDMLISLTARTHELGVLTSVTESLICLNGTETCAETEMQIWREIRMPVRAHQPQTFTKFVALYTGLDDADPLASGQALCRAAEQAGFDRLLAEHSACWEERWKGSDVQIEGDAEAQLALRFSMYHLLSIAPTHADNVSIPARGLSGQVYKGGIFWDTEIFMLPFFAHEFPQTARNLLMYRYHTLDGARRKACEYGYRGAFYAWESQDTGDDACTLFNVTDVFTNRPMRTYFRDKQVHISADIVYAIWKYYTVTGDYTIFLDGCAEVIFECARFLLTYLYYNREKSRYEVLDVTGPDEYHERVHNNAYTNWMFAHAFQVCLRLAESLQQNDPDQAQALIKRLAFQPDLDALREIVANVYQPAPDPNTSIIPQFDGYFKLEDIPLKDLLERKLDPREYLGGGNGLAVPTQILKQADVILGLALFDDKVSKEIKAANWEYYEPRTEQGSSLSACSYAMLAAQIGKVEWAYKFFMATATIDLTGDSKQYVGPLYIGGTHPAANGGAWMALVYGFCGIRWDGITLTIEPHLPAHWTQVNLPLTLHGQKLALSISNQRVIVDPVGPSKAEIMLRVNDKVCPIKGEEKISIQTSLQEHRE